MFLRDGYERVRRDIVECIASKGYQIRFDVGLDYRRVMVDTNNIESIDCVSIESRNTALAKADLTKFLLNISRFYIEIADFVYESDFFLVSKPFLNKMLLCLQTSMRKINSIGDPVAFSYISTVDDLNMDTARVPTGCRKFINHAKVVDLVAHASKVEVIPKAVEIPVTANSDLVDKTPSVIDAAVLQGGVADVVVIDKIVSLSCDDVINSAKVISPVEYTVDIVEVIPKDVELSVTNISGLVDKMTSIMDVVVLQGRVAHVVVTDDTISLNHDIDSVPELRLVTERIVDTIEYPRKKRLGTFELYRYLGVLVDVGVQRHWEYRRRFSIFLALKGAGKSTSVMRLRNRGVVLYEDEEIMKVFPYDGVIAADVDKWREAISYGFVPLMLKTLMAGIPMIWSISNYEYFVRRHPVLRNFSSIIINVSTVYRHVGQSHYEYDAKRCRDREQVLCLVRSGMTVTSHDTLWSALDPDDNRTGPQWIENSYSK